MRALAILAACVAALAVWLWPASIHIVQWSDGGPERVAVFQSLSRLWWLLAAAVAAGWFVRASIVAPLVALGLVAVPYLPWLPDRVPALLAFAGPLRWVIAAVLLAVLVKWLGHGRWIGIRWKRPPSRTTVFVFALLLYLVFGLRSLSVVGLKGDEPHYVIIAHSLLADGDLLIENNHQQRDYRSFTREELPPDFMQRGQNGQIYSIHAPGLPALLVLPYAIGGQYGVMVAMALLGALATAAIAEVAAMVAGPALGVLTALAIGLSVPFVSYAWSVFPEMAGAAIVAWAVLWVVSDKQVTPAQWMARGVCLALLPWLHTKFIIFLAGFTVVLLLRHARAGTLNTAAAALGRRCPFGRGMVRVVLRDLRDTESGGAVWRIRA